MKNAKPIAALAVSIVMLWAAPVLGAELPQKHEYQRVLRKYLAGLEENDFQIERKPLTFKSEWFESEEDLYRAWLLFSSRVPSVTGLTFPPSQFTLKSIEGDKGVMMNARSVAPEALAWWSEWKYPGNPYAGSQALKNRALAAAAVDMLMIDAAHEAGKYKRSDFLGGNLVWLAYTFKVVRDDLPKPVQDAYAAVLKKFVGRLEKWGPTGIHADMDTHAVVGLWYAGQAIGDAKIKQRAEAHARTILRKHLKPAGYVDHGTGFDPSYNGISFYFVTWAAMASDWDFVREGLARMCRLKAHLTLPEPDGENFFGPTHFATTTSASSPNDQWAREHRDISDAMLCEDATYLAFGGRSRRKPNWALPDKETMTQAIQRRIEQLNGELARPPKKAISAWRENHWAGEINYAYDYCRKGFLAKLKALKAESSPLMLPPFSRDEQFIRRFEDTFLIAKFADYGVVIHTGPLSWWGGTQGLAGMSGGALSAFWTPKTGSAILGRNRNRPYKVPDRDTWERWRIWQTHAVSGCTPDGKSFSSARIRRRAPLTVRYGVNKDRAEVSVSGPIGAQHDGGRTTQDGCIKGSVQYARRFTVEPEGLTVETRIASDGKDKVAEMYEMIPAFLKDPYYQRGVDVHQKILFEADGKWVEATPNLAKNVSRIKIERFKGAVLIEFAKPRSVKLAPEASKLCRNILIDLLGSDGRAVPMPSVSVKYRISAASN